MELVRISAAVMGIEVSYAAETAFVSPTLLKIGVDHKKMTLIWALSPLMGFFLTPILGSVSDRCNFNLGRRRPFICLLSFGVFLGLLLIPNGVSLGKISESYIQPSLDLFNDTVHMNDNNLTLTSSATENDKSSWAIFFTVLGAIVLDFDADACQSPVRSFLLDITIPADHARGLSTFTIMAGLGGCLGYALGGINWDNTALGELLGGHVRAVFTLITIIFLICVIYTVTSFKEIPLHMLDEKNYLIQVQTNEKDGSFEKKDEGYDLVNNTEKNYGAIDDKEYTAST